MNKPYVICHMMSTINGKILPQNWGDILEKENLIEVYEKYHQRFKAEAWMCGRTTMEVDFTGGDKPELLKPEGAVDRSLYIADTEKVSFVVAIDPKGKLGWKENHLDKDAIISVLTQQVSDEYLYFLKRKGISYIVAGENQVDFEQVFHLLYTTFGIKKLLLEGGGHINGSVYDLGFIDELSLIVLPIVDTRPDTPTVFEQTMQLPRLKASLQSLKSVEQLEKGLLWLNYQFKNITHETD